MVVDFKTQAQERSYSSTNYPYSEKGPRLMHKIQSHAVISTILIVLTLFMATFNFFVKAELPAIQEGQSYVTYFFSGEVSEVLGTGFLVILRVLFSLFIKLNIIILVFYLPFQWTFLFRYIRNYIKRNQEFERNVCVNDMKASRLRRQILSTLKVRKELKEAKKAAYPSIKDGGKSKEASASALSKIDELKALMKLEVRVNTRQKLTNPTLVETQWTIMIKTPIDNTAYNNLLSRVEKLNDTANRMARGEISIGSYFVTEDRRYIVFQGLEPAFTDPFNYEVVLEEKKKETEVREPSERIFDYGLLIDHSESIAEKKALAEEWSEQIGVMLDRLLITNKFNVTRVETFISASKVSFRYEMAFDSNLSSNVGKFDETIDKIFKVQGSSIGISKTGLLEIILPIPSEYKSLLNVPTLWEEAFG